MGNEITSGTIILLCFIAPVVLYLNRVRIGFLIGKFLYFIRLNRVADFAARIENVPKWKISMALGMVYIYIKYFSK